MLKHLEPILSTCILTKSLTLFIGCCLTKSFYWILEPLVRYHPNLARVDSSSPLCWSQAQEKREGWKPHFCKTTHTQNPQRNTTHRHQPRNSDLFKFFRGRTLGLIAWAVAMNKPG
nr:unnamed protein product [Callosobruchus chinensis]